jgi:hypothetical protein
MTIDWLYAQTITDNIEFPQTWTSGGVLISITNTTPPSWRKLGYLKIEQLIDGEFFTWQYRPIEFGKSSIIIPFNAYRLSFEPVSTLLILHPNISIKIAEFNPNMYISPPDNLPPQIGKPIYTNVTPAAPRAATPIFTIAAARSRRSALITNGTNKAMSINEGSATDIPTLAAALPFVSIPAGQSYTVEDYSGEIVGIMSADYQAGGKVYVKELPYA